MKISKFFLSTLVAAAAMTSTAYAISVSGTADGTAAINIGSGSVLYDGEKYYYVPTGYNNSYTIDELNISKGIVVVVGQDGGFFTTIDNQLRGNGTLRIYRGNSGESAHTSVTVSEALTNFAGTLDFYKNTTGNNYAVNFNASAASATVNVGQLVRLGIGAADITIAGLTGAATDSYVLSNASVGGGTAANDATARILTLSGTGTYSYAGIIGSTKNQSSLNLTKTGTGTQTLSGTTYLGNLEVSGGVLNLNGATTSLLIDKTISVAGGATLNFGDSVAITLADGFAVDATGYEDFNGENTGNGYVTSGKITVWEGDGKVSFGESGGVWVNTSAGVKFVTDGTVEISGTDYSAYHINDGSVNLSDILSDTNTHAGELKAISSTGAASLAIDRGYIWGTYAISGKATVAENVTVTVGNLDSGVTNLAQLSGRGIVEAHAGSNNHSQGITMSDDFTGTIVLTGYLNLPRHSNFGGATKIVLGSEDVKAYLWTALAATYEENFEVNGTYTSGSDGSLRNQQRGQDTCNITYKGSFTLNEGASFGFEQGTTTFSGILTGNTDSALYVAGATVNISGSANLNTVNVTGGTLNILGESTTIGTLAMTGGTTKISGTGTTTIENVSGTSALTKEGEGTLTVSGSGTHSGAITVSGGTLEWTGTRKSNAGEILIEKDAVLDVSSETGELYTTNSHVSSPKITVQGTLKVFNYQYGGSLGNLAHNTGKVLLDGGKIVFENDDTITSTERSTKITANGGVITSGDSAITFTGSSQLGNAFVMENGGVLTFDTKGTITLSGNNGKLSSVDGSDKVVDGKIVKIGTGTLKLASANLYSGGTTIEAGKVIAGNADALGSGDIEISGGTLEVSSEVELAKTTITISLTETNVQNYLWGSGVAISGAGTLAQDTAIVIDADEAALQLITSNSFAIAYANTSLEGVDVSLSADFLQLLNNKNLSINWMSNSGANAFMVIPEPSMFGLLAGLGALALVGTRRRRK